MVYNAIKQFMKYIFNEEENVLNPLDICLYINKNYKNETISNETMNKLYPLIKDKIAKNTTLNFMSNYTFINKKEEEEFLKVKLNNASIFSYTFTIDEYINYRLLNVRRLRLSFSF